MRYTLLLFLTILTATAVCSQDQLSIGEWEDHLPYTRGKWVTQSSDMIYYATDLSVMSLTKDELTPTFIGKLEGLSDVGVDIIAYDNFNDQLLIVYQNSNIDVYTELDVVNIPDIKNNTTISGSKKIQDIHIYNERSALLATSFGIVELDLQSLDFGSTIFTETNVSDITSAGNTLYAATDDGVYSIVVEPTTNIADFSRWQRLGPEVGLPDGSYPAEWIELSGDNKYVVINEELLIQEGTNDFTYTQDSTINAQDIAYITKGNSGVLVGLATADPRSKALVIADDGTITEVAKGCIAYTEYGIEDDSGRYWFADGWNDFRHTTPGGQSCAERLKYNTPTDEKVSDIAVKDGNVYVATGGVDTENGYKRLDFNFSGLYRYTGDEWILYNSNTLPEIREQQFYSIFQVETDRSVDEIYLGSYFEGLMKLNPKTGETTFYNPGSSPLQITPGDPGRERVAGLAFDSDNNLWINNIGAPNPLVVKTPDDTWFTFNPSGGDFIAECVVDQNDYVWSIIVGAGGGVLVYDANGTLADPTDDQQRVINASNSEIEGLVTSLAVDLDGQVWVGTESGPVIFDSGSGVFDSDNRGVRRRVEQDSILALLLETEDIRSIAIDGGNRKWFGTRNGIFVQSPDGEIQIAHFTAENSPLFNNTIKKLTYDGDTGHMYIGTDFGLQVYRTSTLAATNRHAAEVFAFPNPVRPDYEGEIYVKGLARDANVKITDLNGKLVYETEAQGGLVAWDGRDYTGRKASTGVYLVFSTGTQSFDNPDSFVTKILIVD